MSGLQLTLSGKITSGSSARDEFSDSSWWEEFQTWAETNCLFHPFSEIWQETTTEGFRQIKLHLHPAATPLELINLGGNLIMVSTRLTPVGPGYILFLQDMLNRLAGEFNIEWQEQLIAKEWNQKEVNFEGMTEFVAEEIFLEWLRFEAENFLRHYKKNRRLNLIESSEIEYKTDQEVITVLGPKDLVWLDLVEESPELCSDVFPWWKGAFNSAECLLGIAKVIMWLDIHWREPLDDQEKMAHQSLLQLLETSRQKNLDPELKFPWCEWHELIAYSKIQSDFAAEIAYQAEHTKTENRIGYRRENINRNLGNGWTIQVPGSFSETIESSSTWIARDQTRTVNFTSHSYQFQDENKPAQSELLKDIPKDWTDERIQWQNETIKSVANLSLEKEGQKEFWTLSTMNAASGALAICTITFDHYQQKQWAIETWQSLRFKI